MPTNSRLSEYCLMRLSLVAALSMLAGCSGSERATMRIQAIAPTGDTWYRPPQPIWRFAITNTGKFDVVWTSSVEVKGGDDRDYSNAGGHIDWPWGVLAPGQSVVTNMIVPAKQGSVWRGAIEYWPVSREDLKKASDKAERFGLSITEFCPRPEKKRGTSNDEWHQ